MASQAIVNFALLVPLAVAVVYFDVRYRRIPNYLVLATLLSGLILNAYFGAWTGAWLSLKGMALGLGLMLMLHFFGALGAGDVKLFAAIGAIIGVSLVWQTFVIVVLTGGVLALGSVIYVGTLRCTLERVGLILAGFLPGWKPARFPVPADRRQTLPYGVAIVVGSLISLAFVRA